MASFDDLGGALRDAAAENAPRASAIDVDAVTSAARARRRPRLWAVGALSFVAALGVGGLAVAAWSPPVLIAASESADSADLRATDDGVAGQTDGDASAEIATVEPTSDLLGCGTAVPTATQNARGLELELRVAAAAATSADAVEGVAVLTNTGTDSVTVMSRTVAVGVLAQAGIVVGEAAVRDSGALEFLLAPGESRELPVRILISHCDPSTSTPFAAGDYAGVALLEIDGSTLGTTELVVAPAATVRLG